MSETGFELFSQIVWPGKRSPPYYFDPVLYLSLKRNVTYKSNSYPSAIIIPGIKVFSFYWCSLFLFPFSFFSLPLSSSLTPPSVYLTLLICPYLERFQSVSNFFFQFPASSPFSRTDKYSSVIFLLWLPYWNVFCVFIVFLANQF